MPASRISYKYAATMSNAVLSFLQIWDLNKSLNGKIKHYGHISCRYGAPMPGP